MIAALFIHRDGTREQRECEPGRKVWSLPRWYAEDGTLLRAGQRPPPRLWATDTLPPVCSDRGKTAHFHRESWMYPPDWSGPLESWWRWEQHTRWVSRVANAEEAALLRKYGDEPSTVPSMWPVEETWRLEFRYVEEGADG